MNRVNFSIVNILGQETPRPSHTTNQLQLPALIPMSIAMPTGDPNPFMCLITQGQGEIIVVI